MIEAENNDSTTTTRLLRMAIYSTIPLEEIAKHKGKELKKEFPDIVGSCIGKISFIF